MNFCFRIALIAVAFGVIAFAPNDTEAVFQAIKQGAKKAGEVAGDVVAKGFDTANKQAGRSQTDKQTKEDIKNKLFGDKKEEKAPSGPGPQQLPRAGTFQAAPSGPAALPPPKKSSTFDSIKPKPDGPVTGAIKNTGGFGSGH